MHCSSFEEAVDAILAEDGRYARDAYFFVREALDYTVKTLKKPPDAPRHVCGGELLEGLRTYALSEFGPTARRVLRTWGLNRTQDVGDIVFGLVNKGVLGKTESDRPEDFAGGYDFDEAFVKPFLPESQRPKSGPSGRRGGRRPGRRED